MDDKSTGISRRTVAKGAAWAVPAITIATATPAYAVSGTVTADFLSACKSPGNSCKAFPKGYIIALKVCNGTNYPIQIATTSVSNGSLCDVPTTLSTDTTIVQSVAKGACVTVYASVYDQGNSPVCQISGTLHYEYWAPAIGETRADALPGSEPFDASTTPPCSYPGTPPPSTCPPGFS